MRGGIVHRDRRGREFLLRACATLEELDQCIDLQQHTWGYPDRQVVPRNLFVLAQALGGQVLAAWDDEGRLAGFAMAIAAHEPSRARPDERLTGWMRAIGDPGVLDTAPAAAAGAAPIPYLHSHMLAIAPAHRDRGLGFALKLAQREDALARGIRIMRWTFDPLTAKNAYFNLHRLGATARMYIPDFYGRLCSTLQGGLPTDRLLAEWRLDTDRVRRAVNRQPEPPRRVVEKISLPAAVATARAHDARAEVEAMQFEIRSRFQDAFARNLWVEGFQPNPEGGGEYLLTAVADPNV